MQDWVEEFGAVYRMRILSSHVSGCAEQQRITARACSRTTPHHYNKLLCHAGHCCVRSNSGNRSAANAKSYGQKPTSYCNFGLGQRDCFIKSA